MSLAPPRSRQDRLRSAGARELRKKTPATQFCRKKPPALGKSMSHTRTATFHTDPGLHAPTVDFRSSTSCACSINIATISAPDGSPLSLSASSSHTHVQSRILTSSHEHRRVSYCLVTKVGHEVSHGIDQARQTQKIRLNFSCKCSIERA